MFLYSEFCEKFQLQSTVNIFDRTIPIALRLMMIEDDICYSRVSPVLRKVSLEGCDFCSKKRTNGVIRNCILQVYYPNPIRRDYVLKDVDTFEGEKGKIICLKAKEVNFNILNEFYPTNEFLSKFYFEVYKCVFCETNIERCAELVRF